MSKDKGFFVATFFKFGNLGVKLILHGSTMATKFTYKQRSGALAAKGVDPPSIKKLFKNAIVRGYKNCMFIFSTILRAREQIDVKKRIGFFLKVLLYMYILYILFFNTDLLPLRNLKIIV
jgi:hypothetical protein